MPYLLVEIFPEANTLSSLESIVSVHQAFTFTLLHRNDLIGILVK